MHKVGTICRVIVELDPSSATFGDVVEIVPCDSPHFVKVKILVGLHSGMYDHTYSDFLQPLPKEEAIALRLEG